MEALYTWMLDNGLDPNLLPYGAGALAFVILLVIYLYLRGSKTEQQASPTSAVETEARETVESRQVADGAGSAPVETEQDTTEARTQTEVAVESALEVETPVEAKPEAFVEVEPEQPEPEAVEPEADVADEAEQLAQERAEAERQALEQAEAEKAAAEAAARQKAEEEAVAAKAAAEQAEREAAEKARVEAEKAAAEAAAKAEAEQGEARQTRLFERIKSGLSRTKSGLTEQLGSLFLGAKEIDDDLLEEIETLLLMADVGVEATTEIVTRLTERVARKQLKDPEALREALKEELAELLGGVEHPLRLPQDKSPAVILMVGVNGVGKTTTIGKLAKRYQSEGKSVMLAAGDTFRAAAVEQLQVWGERNNVPVVAQHTGADSASVLFDALQSAKAKGVDVLIADTAGRLQNKDNLMQELQKVVRVMQKIDPSAPHEVMLVLDAGTGQNAISQAKQFKEAVGVTGITLTKLDGTAKGGIIFAIAKQFGLPIRFIGVGEQVDDLRPFEANEFVKALFD
ncbi:Signal recognition particle receptor protein [Marinobacterium lacunae]|uniref:Signal recognition particle receptor FtsY n=1 Tax=Marinobacterium lacunae TaxID=1232683 RepID=A0A081FYH5_9GAMM|nr:signal recognition particle-docking protein FtsY [Marinobacterium lacunae]KEA63580.1 Signal recognition particle receptor protein [Marinobacterium lacunae]